MNLRSNNIFLYSRTIKKSSRILKNTNMIKNELEGVRIFSHQTQITNAIKRCDESYYNINRQIVSAECECDSFEYHTPKLITLKLKSIQDVAGFVLYRLVNAKSNDVEIVDVHFFPSLLTFQSISLNLNPFRIQSEIQCKISELKAKIDKETSLLQELQKECFLQYNGNPCTVCPHKNTCTSCIILA